MNNNVFAGAGSIYPWTNAVTTAHSEVLASKGWWLNLPFFAVRIVVYFSLWMLCAWGLNRNSRLQDAGGDVAIAFAGPVKPGDLSPLAQVLREKVQHLSILARRAHEHENEQLHQPRRGSPYSRRCVGENELDEGIDISLGPEMKSTGEVMGIDVDLGLAYAKSQMAAPPPLPTGGNVFVSVKGSDKQAIVPVVREFVKLGFGIIATAGTFDVLKAAEVPVTKVFKLREGRPNVLDRVKNGDINFIINTPSGKIPREDEVRIRNASLAQRIPIMTTVRAALASANGIRSLQKRKVHVRSLQEYHKE